MLISIVVFKFFSLVGLHLVQMTSLQHLHCVQLKLSNYHGDDAPRTHKLCLLKCHWKAVQHIPGGQK